MIIKFKNFTDGIHHLTFDETVKSLDLGEPFFNGVKLDVKMDKSNHQIILDCDLNVKAKLDCDRCLDEYESEFESSFVLTYIIGNEEPGEDENDNLYYISPEDDKINLKKDVFDFAKLSMEYPNFKFAVPKEGAFYFVDNFCIPKNSRNKKNAELFINYMLRPEVAAKNMIEILFPMPISEAEKYLNEKQKKSIQIKIPKETMDKLRISPELGDFMIEIEKGWTKLKSN